MSKEIGIGKAAKLARVGEMVSVSIDGKTITAKVATNLSSTKVLVLFDGRTYHAYPESQRTILKSRKTVLAKHEKRKPLPKYEDSAVIVYKVRYNGGTNIACTLPYWRHYPGVGCVRVCGIGPYFSLNQCNQNNQPSLFEDTYNVGYFKRGFLDVFGAPMTHLDFFYPIYANLNYPYCRGPVVPSGIGVWSATNQVIKGDGTYTSRQWIVPEPLNMDPADIYINDYEHFFYNDPELTASVLLQWNALYGLLIGTPGLQNPYRNVEEWPFGPANVPLGGPWNSWEVILPMLDSSGNLLLREGTPRNRQPFPHEIRVKAVGIPNRVWRQIDIHGILIYNTYYTTGSNEGIEAWLNIREAEAHKRFYTRDPNATLDIRYSTTVRLPPASIISRTYSSIEETPEPPGSGWQLLWDTRTCPVTPPGSGIEFDKDYYYVTTNGTDSKLLGIFRSDDNVDVLLTNLGNGRYRGALRCGTKIVNQVQYFAEIKMFSSEEESIDTYIYPQPIPSVEEDWQDFKYRSWKIGLSEVPPDVHICMRGNSQQENSAQIDVASPGINFIPKLQTYIKLNLPANLESESIQALIDVYGYTALQATETEGERCSIRSLYRDVPIFLPQISLPSSAVSLVPIKISIYSNRS